MAEKFEGITIFVGGEASFNPHHTGEWLKRPWSVCVTVIGASFQSSSYWRMAESKPEQLVLKE